MEAETPEKTVICHLVDREETGSGDMTGMQSTFLQNMIARMCAKSMDNYNDIMMLKEYHGSAMLNGPREVWDSAERRIHHISEIIDHILSLEN